MVKQLLLKNLIAELMLVSTPQIIELYHVGRPSMNIKNNPYTDAYKRQHVRGLINFSYESEINKEMPEGYQDFRAGSRVWGNRLHDTPLVEHKGTYYLEVKVISKITPDLYTFPNGGVIEPDKIKPFLKAKDDEEDFALLRPKDYGFAGIRILIMADRTQYVVVEE